MSFRKSFGTNELFEVINIKKLQKIVKHWKKYEALIVKNNDNDYDYDPKKLCEKYIKNYKKFISISYSKSSKYPSKTGRWFCKNGIGIQSLPRIIRHTVCEGFYIDLDFKNAHPVILQQLCEKNGIPCEYLTTYNNNRDSLLAEWSERINLSKDKTKEIYLCALNGNKMRYDIPYWFEMLEEFKTIHKSIACLPRYETLYKEVDALERDNVFAKVVNRILCTIENDCLTCLFDCLNKRNAFQVDIDGIYYKVCSLIFDGLQLPFNADNEAYCNPTNFEYMSYYIHTKTGFKLDIARKPFDTKLDITDDDEDDDENENGKVIVDDADAGEYILNKYKNYMKNVGNIRWVKSNDVWTSNDDVVKSKVASWINETPMIVITKSGEKYYNRNQSSITKCISWIMANWLDYIPNEPRFIDEVNEKSVGYVPFKDCVYCMPSKKTFKYDECDIQFTQKISRNLGVKNLDAHTQLMKRVIEPCLPDVEERKYKLFRTARALAGHFKDKKWILNKGSRNCGKGVEASLLNSAFDALVGAFNSGCFVKKKFENPDDAKALSWVVSLRNKRLIISNEIPENDVINGIMIKKCASGGDSMVARTNNKDEMEFVPQFTLMFNCNDIKSIEPADAYSSCEQFVWKRQFVPKDQLIEGQEFLCEEDTTIKDFIAKPEIIDAFTWLILDAYADTMARPDALIYSNEELVEEVAESLEKIAIRHFKKTNNPDDKLFTKDITYNLQNDCNYAGSITAKNISTIMLKIGANRTKNGNIRINGEQFAGYMNIKYVPPTAEEKERYNR